MRFTFPKALHRIHRFELDGKRYVADLDCGRTMEVDEILWDLLDLCASHSLHGILEQLHSRYKEGRIFDAIEELERYAARGLLVSSLPSPRFLEGERISPRLEKQRLKLFVPYDVLEHRDRLDALTNFNQYQLLIALARHADVYLALPSDEPELDIDFGQESIHTLMVEPGRLHSPVRFIRDDCDGVLLLSQHPQSELAFFRHSEAPVVCRIEADGKTQAHLPELVLNSYAAAKAYDALCVSASWMKDALEGLLPRADRLLTIPSGADLESFAPMDKPLAKKTVAEIGMVHFSEQIG